MANSTHSQLSIRYLTGDVIRRWAPVSCGDGGCKH